MHEPASTVLIRLPPIWGIDLSITPHVLLLWLAALLLLALILPACRRRSLYAKGFGQNLLEAMIEFVEREVVEDGLGPQGRIWAPFLLSMFFFILFCNLLGVLIIPFPLRSSTANINVTAALAVMVFILTVLISVRRHGALGFLRRFLPEGVPWWLSVLVVPIELVSWIAKPFSLAVRLFANMLAGHALVFAFLALAMGAAWLLKWIPLVGAVLMTLFEIFTSLVQAFVFTMLAGIYIKEALEEPHGSEGGAGSESNA